MSPPSVLYLFVRSMPASKLQQHGDSFKWKAYEEKKHIMTLLRVEPHLETRLVQAPHGGKAASFLGFGGSRAMAVARRAKRAADTMVMVQPTMEGFSGATPPLCF